MARTTVKRGLLLLIIALALIAFRSVDDSPRGNELTDLLDRADKLIVRQDPWEHSPILFESSDRRDLDALKNSLRVERPKLDVHCMCAGTPAIELYADGKKIGQVTNHHAKMIRCNLWESDAVLLDVQAFLQWFDERNIPGPRNELEGDLARAKEWKDHERQWIEGMPPALKPLWPAAKASFDPDLDPLRDALAEQAPEKNARILALLAWYGSGAGPWSGFPSYEDIAAKMLLDYSTVELLAALENQELTNAQTEGAARLFGGWTFSQLRPGDRRLLPADLKARLLDHSLASTDDDKRGRAQRAFGGK